MLRAKAEEAEGCTRQRQAEVTFVDTNVCLAATDFAVQTLLTCT